MTKTSGPETVATPTPPTGPEADAFRLILQDQETQEALRRVLAVFPAPLCMRCLGRPLSRAEKALTNPEKGGLVADVLAVAVADPVDCPWCEGLFEDVPSTSDAVADAVAPYECDTILLATRVHPDVQKIEKQVEAALGALAEHYEPMKTELNRVLAQVVLPRLGVEGRFDRADLVALVDPYFDTVEVTTNSVYLYGRYRKLDRTIPQTKWPCRRCQGRGCAHCDQTGQMYPTSVEALVAEIPLHAFAAKDEAFHGSGREDIDALMLGTGRPFVLELKEPRYRRPRVPQMEGSVDSDGGARPAADAAIDDRVMDLAELEEMINAHARPQAEIEGLRISHKEEVVHIKEAALDKAYRAHVIADEPVPRGALDDAIIQVTAAPLAQQTPKRVLHRRADKTRMRSVHQVDVALFGDHVRIKGEAVNPEQPEPRTEADAATHFTLDIHAESGTYIKELVHGDEGRTQPSFAGIIGIPMKVVALDVVGVGTGPGKGGADEDEQ